MDLHTQRRLGADLAGVLDRYQVHGTNRILVLLSFIWGEATGQRMGFSELAQCAIQAWKHHQGGGDLYGARAPQDHNQR